LRISFREQVLLFVGHCWAPPRGRIRARPRVASRQERPAAPAAPAEKSSWPPPEFAWSCASYGCVGYNPLAVCQCNPGCREHGTCCYDFERSCGLQERVLALAEGQPVQTTRLPPELDDSLCGDCIGDTAPTNEDAVTVYAASCGSPRNRCCGACGMWNNMDHRIPGCQVVHGYLVVPSDPLVGMEAITGGTAPHYDFLWREAADRAGRAEGYVLLVNPSMSRTQHQMHVFFKWLNQPGLQMRDQLVELTSCDSSSADWQDAHALGLCTFARARVFDELPAVFSEVWAEAMRKTLGPLLKNPNGVNTLSTVGITVVFACGGKAIVLATSSGGGYCSLEHSIT